MDGIGIGWVLLGIVVIVVVLFTLYLVLAHRRITITPPVVTEPGTSPGEVPIVTPASPIVNRRALPTSTVEEVVEPRVSFVPSVPPTPAMRTVTIGQLIEESNRFPLAQESGRGSEPVITSEMRRRTEPVIIPEVVSPILEPEVEVMGETIHDNDVISLTEAIFVMRGDYPGINNRENEVTFTSPYRHTIRLCSRGGFLRRMGRGPWQHVQQIRVGSQTVSYLPSGFFWYNDRSTKNLMSDDGERHGYIIRIERA